jgi:hypothetical protein
MDDVLTATTTDSTHRSGRQGSSERRKQNSQAYCDDRAAHGTQKGWVGQRRVVHDIYDYRDKGTYSYRHRCRPRSRRCGCRREEETRGSRRGHERKGQAVRAEGQEGRRRQRPQGDCCSRSRSCEETTRRRVTRTRLVCRRRLCVGR